MGLDMVLRDSRGNRIGNLEDSGNVLLGILVEEPIESCFLSYLDPYDDTVLNSRQAGGLLKEWHELYRIANSEEEAEWLRRAEALVRQCSETHLSYLKFIGD